MGERTAAKGPSKLGPAPNEAALREFALASLARRALSQKGLSLTLSRKIARWARAALRAGRDAEAVDADVQRAQVHVQAITLRFAEVGLIDDTRFAAARATSLARSGKSKRAIAQHLALKGVATETARSAISTDPEDEFRAALVLARRRRIGPFARPEKSKTPDDARNARRKGMAALARAGFDFTVVDRVLRTPLSEAEERLRNIGSL
jgi:regulatory protein